MTGPFGMGPAWARDTQCCGKPVGCTNMSDQCRMLNHPWKKWHRETYGPPCPECDGEGLVPDPSACGDPDHRAGWMSCPRGCEDNLDRVLGAECPSCGDTYHDLPGHLELNYKGCADEAIESSPPAVLLSVSR